MSAAAPSRMGKFFSRFRRGPTPTVPAGPNSSAVNAAVKKYVANFRNMQSVARQPNLYGNSFRNLPINRPLIKALRNYINATSNFKKLAPNTTSASNLSKGNVGGMGPANLSKQNVINAANKAIKAATVANNKLQNVATLRAAYTNAKPLTNSARQLYNKLFSSLASNPKNPKAAQELSANGTLNKALFNSEKKLSDLRTALNAAEKVAGTGAAPVGTGAVASIAQTAALNAFKATLAAYNNTKLNIAKPNNVKMYMNMNNLNARRSAINEALVNVSIQDGLNNASKNKLGKVKAMLNKAKANLNAQKAQVIANANAAAAEAAAKAAQNAKNQLNLQAAHAHANNLKANAASAAAEAAAAAQANANAAAAAAAQATANAAAKKAANNAAAAAKRAANNAADAQAAQNANNQATAAAAAARAKANANTAAANAAAAGASTATVNANKRASNLQTALNLWGHAGTGRQSNTNTGKSLALAAASSNANLVARVKAMNKANLNAILAANNFAPPTNKQGGNRNRHSARLKTLFNSIKAGNAQAAP